MGFTKRVIFPNKRAGNATNRAEKGWVFRH